MQITLWKDMQVSTSTTDEALLEDAFDWLIRRQEATSASDIEAALQVWLKCSPAHQRAWEKACRSWDVVGRIEPHMLAAIEDEKVNPVSPVRLSRARNQLARFALAACLVLALLVTSYSLHNPADYSTGTGERLQITLNDGTVVEMGADTALDVGMTQDRRQITLLRGEAFFDVTPDAARPFTVTAGATEIRVLGTAFDVDYRDDETIVQLEHGHVSVKGPSAGEIQLAPGQTVSVRPKDGTITRGVIDTADIGAWRQGRLFVEDQSIASVVAVLQRYHKGFIRIASGELAARHVTGSYDLSDPDRALSALVEAHGGKVYRLSPYLRVLVGS